MTHTLDSINHSSCFIHTLYVLNWWYYYQTSVSKQILRLVSCFFKHRIPTIGCFPICRIKCEQKKEHLLCDILEIVEPLVHSLLSIFHNLESFVLLLFLFLFYILFAYVCMCVLSSLISYKLLLIFHVVGFRWLIIPNQPSPLPIFFRASNKQFSISNLDLTFNC